MHAYKRKLNSIPGWTERVLSLKNKYFVIANMWNLKNITNEHILYNKQKQTHRYRAQTSGYQLGEGTGYEKTGYIIGYIVQHSHYSVVTLNGVKSIKIFNHYTT